eukprot:SAG11_NODE_2368_length_3448_cov_12.401015_2_plen_105_part_00
MASPEDDNAAAEAYETVAAELHEGWSRRTYLLATALVVLCAFVIRLLAVSFLAPKRRIESNPRASSLKQLAARHREPLVAVSTPALARLVLPLSAELKPIKSGR